MGWHSEAHVRHECADPVFIRNSDTAELTRNEAENIISFINIARNEGYDIIKELTEKLQRISGNRAV